MRVETHEDCWRLFGIAQQNIIAWPLSHQPLANVDIVIHNYGY